MLLDDPNNAPIAKTWRDDPDSKARGEINWRDEPLRKALNDGHRWGMMAPRPRPGLMLKLQLCLQDALQLHLSWAPHDPPHGDVPLRFVPDQRADHEVP